MSLVSGWMVRSGSALLAAYLAASPAAAQTAGSGSANPNALYRAGNGVTKPQLISKVQPDYTEVARKCGVSGLVVLAIVVNSDGTAQNFRVMKTLGFGLDEKAIEAVSQWRFAPGMKDGEPVRVAATVEVNFHLGERRGEFMWHTGGLEFPAVPGRTAPQAIDGSFPKPAKQPLNESAIFEFTVASNGRVTDIRTVLGGREIVALLQPHLEAWRFEPAMANGAAVAATGRVAFFNGEPDPVLRKSLYPASNPATAAPRTFAPPVVRTAQNPKDGLEYVWIPAGAFMMGCSESDTECAAEERPQAEKHFASGFWMTRTLVTQGAFSKVAGGNPSKSKGADLPVESVTWNDAFSYCAAIGGRLPSEAEWEYAARAGVSGSRYGALSAIAWYRENSGGVTHPVAQKQPNPLGLFDMLGNVGEWVEDAYPGVAQRIVRGGSALKPAEDARASWRGRFDPSLSFPDVGFRCVMDRAPSSAAAPVAAVAPAGDFAPPRLVRRVEPGYTEAARNARASGVVVVEIVVSDSGMVTDVKVLTSLGYGLDEKAIEAVKQWKFEPARRDGHPVRASLKAEVAFRAY